LLEQRLGYLGVHVSSHYDACLAALQACGVAARRAVGHVQQARAHRHRDVQRAVWARLRLHHPHLPHGCGCKAAVDPGNGWVAWLHVLPASICSCYQHARCRPPTYMPRKRTRSCRTCAASVDQLAHKWDSKLAVLERLQVGQALLHCCCCCCSLLELLGCCSWVELRWIEGWRQRSCWGRQCQLQLALICTDPCLPPRPAGAA